jgi:glutamyl-tRNA reductase
VALDLVIVGLSHHTAPVEVREKLSLANGSTEQVLADMVATPSVREVVLLSTCNRVEVVACCEQGGGAESGLTTRLLSIGGLERGAVADSLFELHGRDAVRHVFRVAASLDSMVVGEPQILGQVKQQFEVCDAADAVGPVLHRVFHKSFSVAKRVRSETGVAGRAVSVASIAADLAGQIFEDLRERVLLVLGAGEIGEAAAASWSPTVLSKLPSISRDGIEVRRFRSSECRRTCLSPIW